MICHKTDIYPFSGWPNPGKFSKEAIIYQCQSPIMSPHAMYFCQKKAMRKNKKVKKNMEVIGQIGAILGNLKIFLA